CCSLTVILSLFYYSLFFSSSRHHRYLHSFPTRRSSDLIYFTNAPTVEMALRGETAPGALYHNNHDGTFTDVTARSGMQTPCFGMGGAVGDYDNDGWPDIYLTCLAGNVLYHNNGDGTFTDVTPKAGVRDGRWSTGAAFADYDGDGFLDLMVANYVDLDL